MKKTYFKSIIVALAVSFGFSSCTDWLDVNTNKLAATEVDPGYLFNYAATSHSGIRQGGDQYMAIGFSCQTIAGGGSNWGGWGEEYYEISTSSRWNKWVGMYSVVGTNLMNSMKFAEKGANLNGKAQAMILMAAVMYEGTMIFGDIPYTEAWRIAEIPYPKFDSQKVVLEKQLESLDAAIALIDPAKKKIDKYDLYYNGDMNKWVKLANSLKLRILMVMAKNDPAAAPKIKALVEAGNLITENTDRWKFPYYTTPGLQNPKYRIKEMYADMVYWQWPHASMVNPMNATNDPRRAMYFALNEDDHSKNVYDPANDVLVYKGIRTTQAPEEDDEELLETALLNWDVLYKADAEDLLLSAQEVNFILAEVYARGIGVTKNMGTANTYYKKAVEQACKYWGVEDADITTFKASLADLTTLSDADAVKAINMQQWIDLMDRPTEAWVNQRRTGTPALEVPDEIQETYKDLMHRWEYPDEERAGNPNIPSPLPQLYDKMWFE